VSRVEESRVEEGRVEASRRRVQRRLADVGRAAGREKERALAIKDAALAVLGAVGLLLATRRVAKGLGSKKRRKKSAADRKGGGG
jgi:hypothetical protein